MNESIALGGRRVLGFGVGDGEVKTAAASVLNVVLRAGAGGLVGAGLGVVMSATGVTKASVGSGANVGAVAGMIVSFIPWDRL